MVSLCTILHGHGTLGKIMTRSWRDLGKASKELAMDLGKGTMASDTENSFMAEHLPGHCRFRLFIVFLFTIMFVALYFVLKNRISIEYLQRL